MKPSTDPAHDLAADVLRAIGTAVGERSVFGESHPRYVEAMNRLEEAIAAYVERSPGSPAMSFLLDGDQAEFRRVPIVDPGPQGERAIRWLREGGCEGLRIRLPAGSEDLKRLVGSLRDVQGRASSAPARTASPGIEFLDRKEARDLRRTTTIDEAGVAAAGAAAVLVPEFEVSEDACRSILATCRLILSNSEGGISIDGRPLAEAADGVVRLFSGSDPLRQPRLARSYFDDFSFHHSANVCLIATAVASTLVKDPAQLRAISMAALLHDVGKREVPAEIIHKPGKLTPEEFEIVQRHPIHGAEILLGVDGLDPLCVSVAFGHHIQGGQGGYPKTRFTFRPSWISQLISVVDIYEALTAVRPYKKGLSPETAFRILFTMAGVQDRVPLMKLLYDCLGPYPVGSLVELTSGHRAVVVARNPSSPSRPKIRLLTDPVRNPLKASTELDLARDLRASIGRTIVAQGPRADLLRDDSEEATDILGEPLENDQVLMAREG